MKEKIFEQNLNTIEKTLQKAKSKTCPSIVIDDSFY